MVGPKPLKERRELRIGKAAPRVADVDEPSAVLVDAEDEGAEAFPLPPGGAVKPPMTAS